MPKNGITINNSGASEDLGVITGYGYSEEDKE